MRLLIHQQSLAKGKYQTIGIACAPKATNDIGLDHDVGGPIHKPAPLVKADIRLLIIDP